MHQEKRCGIPSFKPKNGSWNAEKTVRAERSRSMNGFFCVHQLGADPKPVHPSTSSERTGFGDNQLPFLG